MLAKYSAALAKVGKPALGARYSAPCDAESAYLTLTSDRNYWLGEEWNRPKKWYLLGTFNFVVAKTCKIEQNFIAWKGLKAGKINLVILGRIFASYWNFVDACELQGRSQKTRKKFIYSDRNIRFAREKF